MNLHASPPKWMKLLRYKTRFELPELLRKKYTMTVPKSKYQAKWQKLLLSRSAPKAAGTAAICNYCKRHLKRKSMPNHAIANGMWMDTASTIPEYADLSEMEALLLASAGRTHAAIKIYLESAAAPNGKGWSMKRPNLYVFLAIPKRIKKLAVSLCLRNIICVRSCFFFTMYRSRHSTALHTDQRSSVLQRSLASLTNNVQDVYTLSPPQPPILFLDYFEAPGRVYLQWY